MKPNCAICGEQAEQRLVAECRDTSVRSCVSCSGVSVTRLPSQAELARAYTRFNAGELARANFDAYRKASVKILRNELTRSGRLQVEGLRFFDYGCGGGHFLAAARELGMKCVGMEFDPVSVNEAKLRRLDVIQGALPTDAERLGDAHFDVIKCMHVLEHVPRPFEVLRSLANRLSDGGVLLLGVPDQASVPSKIKILLRALGVKRNEYGFVQPPIHLHGFNERALRAAASAAGLSVDWLVKSGPLDSTYFPTTPDYWTGLSAQRAVYVLGKILGSPGHFSAGLRTQSAVK